MTKLVVLVQSLSRGESEALGEGSSYLKAQQWGAICLEVLLPMAAGRLCCVTTWALHRLPDVAAGFSFPKTVS